MSTVLAYTSPAIGHLFPMVPLLLELKARGHDIHLRTLPGQVAAMRELGFHAAPVDQQLLELEHHDYLAKSVRTALASSVDTFTARARFDAPDFRAAMDDVGPDLLLLDVNAWGAGTVAESAGLPWATVSPYIPPLESKGTPPFGPGLARMHGPLGRARDAVVRRVVIAAVEKVMMPGINRMRADASGGQLPPLQTADAFFRRAPLMLVTTAEPFEYPHPDWGPGVRMIGALPWEPPAELPAWFDSIDKPVVLVTTSSEYQADEKLVRTALEGLANEPFIVVATVPASGAAGTAGAEGLAAVPANGRMERFVPHGPVLERAAVAVTHGGMGATQKALARGVPVVVVPFGRDQNEVAARVVAADAGVRLRPAKLTPETLRAAVHEAIGKAAGARRVAAGYVAAGGAVAGVDALEDLLSKKYTGHAGAAQ